VRPREAKGLIAIAGCCIQGIGMSDDRTSVLQVRQWVAEFVDQRDWNRFHAPKNLAMSIAIEAAELMEHFQWISVDDSRCLAGDPTRQEAIRDELADVMCYALALSNVLGIDLSEAIRSKLEKNARKYPVSEYRGRYGPDDPRPTSPPS